MGVFKQMALIFAFSFLSCGILNVESDKIDEEWYIEAKVNGKKWRVTANAIIVRDRDVLIIGGNYFYNSYYYESLDFGVPASESIVGVYDLNQWEGENGEPYGASFTEIDWDVVIVGYLPNGDPSNRMIITSYDSSTGVIEGTFQVTFLIDPNWYKDIERLKQLGITPPQRKRTEDTISFTEGRFRVRLRKI